MNNHNAIKNKDFLPKEVLSPQLYRLADNAYQHGSPWTERQFCEDLANPHSHYLLLVKDDEILGYLNYHQILDEVEIANVVVAKSQQGGGLGSKLLKKLIETCREQDVATIFLEVRVSNHSAQKLYLGNGFEVISRRKDYYQAPVEDAIVMSRKSEVQIS